MKTTIATFTTMLLGYLISISMAASYPHSEKTTSASAINQSPVYNPFQINIDPMESLLLITFAENPDTLYIGLEPQTFNDSVNGHGLLVIAWRADGFVDVYHQPTLHLDRNKYDIAGKGLANMIMAPLNGAYFYVNNQGVQSWFQFDDLHGRPIEVTINERNTLTRKPFGLLAPMGNAAETPSSMPLVLLHDFYFARQKDSEVSILINGKIFTPDKLPIRMDGQKMYFIRYSPDPLIATLNPAHNGALMPLQENISSCGQKSTIVEIGNRQAISSLSRAYKNRTVELAFNPPFPNVATLLPGETATGKFTVAGCPTTGKISGTYHVKEENSEVIIRLHPSGGWKPRPDKLSLRLMYTVAKVFRKWPKTYYWNALVIFDETGTPHMQSAWTRQ